MLVGDVRVCRGWLLLMLMSLLLSACGGGGAVAPVGRETRNEALVHTVQRGDTLYYIAWRYARDYQGIARLNGLSPPYTIHPGQRLRLDTDSVAQAPVFITTAPAQSPVTPARSADTTSSARQPATPSSASTAVATTSASDNKTATTTTASSRAQSSTADDDAPVRQWRWPTRGPLLSTFGQNERNGIEIGGQQGQPISAAAAGVVVYSGSGLIGYGKLIIVKHNKQYLSAYAHNAKILVNEGDRVDIGEKIGEMGSTGADRVKLHFEIRRDGKPVDPVRYLPG